MDIKSLTAKKVAGIPVVWLVLGVTVVALYGAIKIKPTATTDTTKDPTTDPNADITGDAGVDTSQPVFQATPTIMQPSGPATSVSSTPSPDTDTLWSRRAIEWLRQNGFSLEVSTSAINKYLSGDPLTAQEALARDKAVQQFGLPPETIPNTSTVTPDPVDVPTTPSSTYSGPAAKQGVPPVVHTVKGTSDNQFNKLALLYYGHAGQGEGLLIQSWNPSLHMPLAVGTKVHIPRYVNPSYYKATSATRTAVAIAAKNGLTVQRLRILNPHDNFPVRAGTRVRVR